MTQYGLREDQTMSELIIKEVNQENVQEGSIITFHEDSGIVTHRVVEVVKFIAIII